MKPTKEKSALDQAGVERAADDLRLVIREAHAVTKDLRDLESERTMS